MTTQELLSRLNKVSRVGERRWKALCPAHLEKTPSLAIHENHQGDTLVHCFGCGATVTQVARAMGLQVIDFFHDGIGTRSAPIAPRRLRPIQVEAQIDWVKWVNERLAEERKDLFTSACEHIKLPEKSIRAIGGFWHYAHTALAFPMYHIVNGLPKVVGARLRSNDGKKWAVRGSHNGLFIPVNMYPQEHLWIAEGPTDTACLLSLGFWAIGRASCSHGVEHVVAFVKANKPHQITIVADKDACGVVGAKVLASNLPVPTRLIVPQLKDIRMWVERGATRAMIEAHANRTQFRLWQNPSIHSAS